MNHRRRMFTPNPRSSLGASPRFLFRQQGGRRDDLCIRSCRSLGNSLVATLPQGSSGRHRRNSRSRNVHFLMAECTEMCKHRNEASLQCQSSHSEAADAKNPSRCRIEPGGVPPLAQSLLKNTQPQFLCQNREIFPPSGSSYKQRGKPHTFRCVEQKGGLGHA